MESKFINDIAEVIPGATKQFYERKKVDNVPPSKLIRGEEISTHGSVNIQALQTVYENPTKDMSRYVLRCGDVVLLARGTAIRAALLSESIDSQRVIASANTLIIRPRNGMDGEGAYLVAYLNSMLGQKALEASSRGTMIASISASSFRTLAIPFPDKDERDKVAAIYWAGEEAYRAAMAYAEQLRCLAQAKIVDGISPSIREVTSSTRSNAQSRSESGDHREKYDEPVGVFDFSTYKEQREQLQVLLGCHQSNISPLVVIEVFAILCVTVEIYERALDRLCYKVKSWQSGDNEMVVLLEWLDSVVWWFVRRQARLNVGTDQLFDHFQHTYDRETKIVVPKSTLKAMVEYLQKFREHLRCTAVVLRDSYVEWENDSSQSGSKQFVQELMIELLRDTEIKCLYDGCAGLAFNAAALLPKDALLVEKDLRKRLLAERLLKLEGKYFRFYHSDGFSHSKNSSDKFDVVVMEPPSSYRVDRESMKQLIASEVIKVNPRDQLPVLVSDTMWIQLALFRLVSNGKAYLILAQDWLYRGAYNAEVRDYLLDKGFIEAIIWLPKKMFAFNSKPKVLLILRKTGYALPSIRFVDARGFGKNRASSKLHEYSYDDITLIAELARGEHVKSEQCRSVEISEIRRRGLNGANGNSLYPGDYFDNDINEELPDVRDEMQKLREVLVQLKEASVNYQRHVD